LYGKEHRTEKHWQKEHCTEKSIVQRSIGRKEHRAERKLVCSWRYRITLQHESSLQHDTPSWHNKAKGEEKNGKIRSWRQTLQQAEKAQKSLEQAESPVVDYRAAPAWY
jgi:hypothetical protein